MKFIIDGGFVHWHCNLFPIRLYVFLIITSNSNEAVEDRACIASLKGKDRGLLKSLKNSLFLGGTMISLRVFDNVPILISLKADYKKKKIFQLLRESQTKGIHPSEIWMLCPLALPQFSG